MRESLPWAEAWEEEIKALFQKSFSFAAALAGLIRLRETGYRIQGRLAEPLYQGLLLSALEAIREEKEFPRLVRKRLFAGQETRSYPVGAGIPEAEFDPLGLPFKEAIKWFQKKQVISPERFKFLDFRARSRAFSVARLQNEYVLEGMKEEINRALKEGMTFLDFKNGVDDLFDSYGLKRKNPWHLETVFQNNIQSAYNAGHLEQMEAQKDTRPFWQYFTAGDDKVRPGHFQWHLTIFPADHPFWDRGYPPNGHRCRCRVLSLSREEMEMEGLEEFRGDWQNPQHPFPDEGFAGKPAL